MYMKVKELTAGNILEFRIGQITAGLQQNS